MHGKQGLLLILFCLFTNPPANATDVSTIIQKFFAARDEYTQVLNLGAEPKKVAVKFSALGKYEHGNCTPHEDGVLEIQLNRETWDSLSEVSREILVFHELGHCVLERGHVSDGIMQEHILDEAAYLRKRTHYLKAFFNPVLGRLGE